MLFEKSSHTVGNFTGKSFDANVGNIVNFVLIARNSNKLKLLAILANAFLDILTVTSTNK